MRIATLLLSLGVLGGAAAAASVPEPETFAAMQAPRPNLAAAAPGAKRVLGELINLAELKGGTRITVNVGSDDGVEFGDHGVVLDGERVVTRFNIDKVTPRTAAGFVPVGRKEMDGFRKIAVELSPGKMPKTLGSKDMGAGPLGSCASNHKMYKAGSISSWIPSPDGKIYLLVLEDVGWKHRVCADSTGMIYDGGVGDAFVTDKYDRKIRLRIVNLGYETSVAEVFQGDLDETVLGGDRRVVFRAKK
jgi:hypothetical protein